MKIAAVVLAAMGFLLGATPTESRDPAAADAVVSSSPDAAHGVLPSRHHAQPHVSLLRLVAVLPADAGLVPPGARVRAREPFAPPHLAAARASSAGIRAPPVA